MNSYYQLALLFARQEAAQRALETANSALPNTPVIPEAEKTPVLWMDALRGRLATRLHRIAWALDPDGQIDADR